MIAVAAVAAGCGGSHHSDSAAIRAALIASPATYLHYGRRTWGTTPRFRARIRVVGDRATAVLSAPRAIPQQIALRRRGGRWRITSTHPAIINGPLASRPASPSELAAISRVARRVTFQGHDSCVTYIARVSTLDPRYARVDYKLRKPYGNCLLGNGESIYARTRHGWRHVGDASDGFPCGYLPAGVVRSLFGACWTSR